MSVQRFKAALNNARIPFVSSQAPRAVFVPGLDTAQRTPRAFVGTEASADYSVAQILFGENVMPAGAGINSVGYYERVAASVNNDFDSIFALRDAVENTVLFSPAGGNNYIYDSDAGAWTINQISNIIAAEYPYGTDKWELAPGTTFADKLVTYAYVDGKTLICYPEVSQRLKVLTGILANPASTSLHIVCAPSIGGTLNFVYGTNSELTISAGRWFLDISSLTNYNNPSISYTVTISETPPASPVIVTTREYASAVKDASLYFWNGTSLELAGDLVKNLPFDPRYINGISSSNGYLIVYSRLTVAWAAFDGASFDFLEFANGAATGSGYQIPEDVLGNIRAAIPLSGGFALFTDRNAIAATYHAQNLAAPWVFREIPDAGGLESYEQATVEGTLGRIYAYTTAGFQLISLNSAEAVFPDASDFITGRKIERYEADIHNISGGGTTLDMYVKVTNVGNRFIVISYGTFPKVYSYALVYDRFLERWGKLRYTHRDCFYYAYGTVEAPLTYAALPVTPYDSPDLGTYAETLGQSNLFTAAPHGLAFMESNGRIVLANWSNEARGDRDDAVVVIGRVQLTRANHTQLNRIEIEGLTNGDVFIQPSYDGRILQAAEATVDCGSVGDFGYKGCMIDCKNFNLVVEGTFQMSTVIFEALPSGKIF